MLLQAYGARSKEAEIVKAVCKHAKIRKNLCTYCMQTNGKIFLNSLKIFAQIYLEKSAKNKANHIIVCNYCWILLVWIEMKNEKRMDVLDDDFPAHL